MEEGFESISFEVVKNFCMIERDVTGSRHFSNRALSHAGGGDVLDV